VSQTSITITGTPVVAGCAYAPAVWVRARRLPPTDFRRLPKERRQAEIDRFHEAVDSVSARLQSQAAQATGEAAEVLAATAALASDRSWVNAAAEMIESGSPAEAAIVNATEKFVRMFQEAGGRIEERVTDLCDIRDRVVAELMGEPEPGVPTPEGPVVLLADDLAPADTARLDPTLILALCTRLGGLTSHTSVIARQLGIPCVVGVSGLYDVADGVPVLVNGAAGTIRTGVQPEDAASMVAADEERREAARVWRGPAATQDGTRVELLANVQDGASARRAAAGQAQGVGLFRTELGFLPVRIEPTIEAQADNYAEVFEAFPGSKVVVRTFDAGSDKLFLFANHLEEHNPALGVRGIRLDLTNPGLLDRQLDGIALAAQRTGTEEPWVMAPMVATVGEARQFAEKCRRRGLSPGIMVEVPAVVMLADEFFEEVDFVSIGTNDLAQYVMAADRGSPPLGDLTTPWQPAVLRMIEIVAEAGLRAGKPVGVCGEAAADPMLACVLLGLGVSSLSMAATAIPAVGVQIEQVTLEQCREAARLAVASFSSEDARAAVSRLLG
jgi:phosphotransferase system enzyme I (PtsI)